MFGFVQGARIDPEMILSMVVADDAPRVREALRAAFAAADRQCRATFRIRRANDGAERWINCAAQPFIAEGRDSRLIGTCRDVTVERDIERLEELRASEARFRALFDANLIGIFYGNAVTGAINEANDKFLEMVGYSREELVAGCVSWRQITAPEYRHVVEAAAAEVLATGKNAQPFASEGVRRDGTRTAALVACALLDNARDDAVAFILDITEQKKNEARERKLHANRIAVMQSMAAGIAHEINQPLAAAGAYLHALRRLHCMSPERRPRSVADHA
jgi:PAS domain S-box-containing protein